MNDVNILLSANKLFFPYLEELITSLTYYSSKFLNIYLMYVETELSIEDLEYIKNFTAKTNNGKLIPIKFNTTGLKNVPLTDNVGSYFGLETYSRLFVAFYLPKEV